ncbi:MAG: site-2 protease family protein, partial [Elioraea tepidiphila]
MIESILWGVAVIAPGALVAIILHEVAHGWAANALGDPTAKRLGRLSLNPARHVDPFGTIALPLILFGLQWMTIGRVEFLFGWAKPVPVSFGNLRHPKRDMIWVAAAGPGANLAMAVAWTLFLKLQLVLGLNETFFVEMAKADILVNIGLMALNLLP